MKKIIALLLCLLMIVGMVACATNTDNNDQTDGSQDTTPATENSDSSDDTNGNDGDVVTITYSYWGTRTRLPACRPSPTSSTKSIRTSRLRSWRSPTKSMSRS